MSSTGESAARPKDTLDSMWSMVKHPSPNAGHPRTPSTCTPNSRDRSSSRATRASTSLSSTPPVRRDSNLAGSSRSLGFPATSLASIVPMTGLPGPERLLDTPGLTKMMFAPVSSRNWKGPSPFTKVSTVITPFGACHRAGSSTSGATRITSRGRMERAAHAVNRAAPANSSTELHARGKSPLLPRILVGVTPSAYSCTLSQSEMACAASVPSPDASTPGVPPAPPLEPNRTRSVYHCCLILFVGAWLPLSALRRGCSRGCAGQSDARAFGLGPGRSRHGLLDVLFHMLRSGRHCSRYQSHPLPTMAIPISASHPTPSLMQLHRSVNDPSQYGPTYVTSSWPGFEKVVACTPTVPYSSLDFNGSVVVLQPSCSHTQLVPIGSTKWIGEERLNSWRFGVSMNPHGSRCNQ